MNLKLAVEEPGFLQRGFRRGLRRWRGVQKGERQSQGDAEDSCQESQVSEHILDHHRASWPDLRRGTARRFLELTTEMFAGSLRDSCVAA